MALAWRCPFPGDATGYIEDGPKLGMIREDIETMRLHLVSPSQAHEAAFMAMIEEFIGAGEREYVYEQPLFEWGFPAYLDWLIRGEQGELDGLVPWSAFWALDASSGALVGMSSLRHRLSPWMAQFGGHIGYRIRPTLRRRGLGAELLRLTLARAGARGIANALVVCTPDNLGSQGVLRRNGAQFDGEVSTQGHSLNRYWVSTIAGEGN
ncbi:GNAT family N-acetyltransferase [Ideonella sp. DXS29W]|uniref:GNAT family N-acetyltransferase n=1 Tax=Ideonella lacteola TaxID=2984193 RepID=A0ABU9C062_9BURK